MSTSVRGRFQFSAEEGIERQRLNPQLRAGFHRDTDRFDTRFMARRAWQVALFGPSAARCRPWIIAMWAGKLVRIDSIGECPVLAAGLQDVEELLSSMKFHGTPERRRGAPIHGLRWLCHGSKTEPEETHSQGLPHAWRNVPKGSS